MVDLAVVKSVTVQGRTEGLDKVAADLKNVAAGQDRVVQSSAKLVTATVSVDRSTLSAQRSLDSFTRSMDPVARAFANLERGQRAAAAAQAQGIALNDNNMRALANVRARYDEAREAADKHTASTSLNRMQMMEATHVAKSLFDEMAAGASPLRALSLEGGRIAQIFAEGNGGVGGTLKSLGSSVLSLATGWAGLGVAAAAAGALAFSAATSFVDGQSKMAASLEGTGRAAGLTFGQLGGIATAGAAAGRISIGDAQNTAGTLAHAGVGGSVNQALTSSVRDFARVSDTGIDAAAKTLAEAFADPEKGAASLNAQLGFLNDRILTTIHQQEAAGNIEGARQTLLTAYNASLADITDRTWTLSKAFDSVKVGFGNAFNQFGKDVAGMFGQGDPADKLRQLQTQQGLLPANDTFNRGRLQAEIDTIAKQLGQQDTQDRARADAAKRAADADALSLQARDAIRSVLPEIGRQEQFATQSGILQRSIANPSGLIDPASASQALGNLSVQHTFSDPMTVFRQDAELARASVDAFSLAERAAVDARRAELEVLRESGDVAKASAAAHDALNLAMAKARSDAEDRLATSKQNLAMVGMSPFERGMQEIRNRYEGNGGIFEKDAASKSDLTDALKPVGDDIRNAGALVRDALRDAAAAIRGGAGAIPGSIPALASGSFTGGNAAYVLKALVANGYNAQASAGFVGGLTGESGLGLDTSARNASGHVGIAQWDPARAAGLTMFSGTPIEPQTALILQELQTSEARAGALLRSATTVQGGLNANLAYERPSASEIAGSYGQRLANGNALNSGSGFSASASAVSDAAATMKADQGAEANDLKGFSQDRFSAPLAAANQALNDQIKLLDVQQSTMGKSAAEIQAAAKAQELWNTYTAMDPNRSAGPAVWQKLSAGIDDYRSRMQGVLEKQAEFNQQQQKMVGALDSIRSTGSQALGGFLTDIKNGQSAGKAFNSVLNSIEDKMLNAASNKIIGSLFGQTGTANGGILGGLFSGGSAGTGGLLASIFHEGGVVGGAAPARLVDSMMFAGAPRYHSGYGLASDERPAILQLGEAVVSRADLAAARAQKSQATTAPAAAAAGTGSGAPPVIHIHSEAGTQVADVKTSRGPSGEHVIEAMVVNTMLKDLNNGGKYSRALKSFGNVGRTGA